MFSNLIKKYIENLTKNDIISFALNENIKLNNKEIDIIFNTIKNDYNTLLYGNSDKIFEKLKKEINLISFNKIKKYFDYYKEKYKNYL
jgi:hypothetical protein